MEQNISQDIDVSSANQIIGKSKGEQIFINYTAEKFRLSERKENMFFSEVTSCELISKSLVDNAETIAKYTFVITGLMSAVYTVGAQGGNLLEFILSFAVTGVIWGAISYSIASFSKKEKWIFNVKSIKTEFSIIMDRVDGERITRIFENHIPTYQQSNDEPNRVELKPDLHEKKLSSITPEKFDELVRLKALLDQQIISEDEFKLMKEDLLSKK
jgi:hypothetical protein